MCPGIALFTHEKVMFLSLSLSSFPFLLLLLLRETLTSNFIPKQHLQVLSTNPTSLILASLQVVLNLNDSWTRGSTVSNSGSLTVLLYYSAPYFSFNTCSFASLRKCKSTKTGSCWFFFFFFQNNSNVREESEAFVWRCRETNDNLFIRKKQDWENSAHISLFMTFFQAVLIYTILVYFFIFIFFLLL